MLLYETKLINGKEWRQVIEADDPRYIGKYKCQCGAFIKSPVKMEGHLQTPSHQKSLDWKRQFKASLPTGHLLLGFPVIIK